MSNNQLHKEASFIFVHIGIPTEFEKIGMINVGITAGLEADKITKEWVEGCNRIDLVIVPSNFVKEVFINSGVTTRVEVIEEGVDTSLYNDSIIDTTNDLLKDVETDINLLSVGQWLDGGIGEDRKGIGLVIDTFLKTFEGNPKVGLILKTYINNNSTVDYSIVVERLKELKQNRKYPQIHLVHGNLTNKELVQLYKHPKVAGFVSLTSGEGWGRGIAEAIACNLPVAVTGWGGQMHYINSNFVKLIDFTLKPVSRGALATRFFTPDMVWAHPNVDDAKRRMKHLIENPLSNKKRAKEYGEQFRKQYSKEAIYPKLVSLFEELGAQLETNFSKNNVLVEKI
jgi:glycosyltransferase involved in cell wall biosynthesis